MNRANIHIIDSDFPEIYSWLSFFTQYYDNAEKEVQIVLRGIVQAYIETKAAVNQPVTEEEALAFLTVRNRNPRNAGRKPKFTQEQQAQMLTMMKSGMDKKAIAGQFHCSVSYLDKLWRRSPSV